MIWFLAIALLLGLALALQAGLVAFAGYVILGVFLLSRFLTSRWVQNLQAQRACDSIPREIGESTEVIVTLTNTGTLPILWVLVEDLIPDLSTRLKPSRLSVRGKRIQVASLGTRKTKIVKYSVTFQRRGYYPLGPTLLETGDVFGLHRRHRVVGKPVYVMVYPKVIPLPQYNFASERPIGEVRLQNRLFEDPTRTAGVREYQLGDPLQRVHWKVTARMGVLHCRVYEPTTLAGATLLIDFHVEGYPKRSEPHRSDLVVTTAASIAHAVSLLNQQIGMASNGRDAAERVREELLADERCSEIGYKTRDAARERFELQDDNQRLRPVSVETRRGFDQFQQIREALARLEMTDGFDFARLSIEMAGRIPRDATVIAILPRVPLESAVALGTLRRQGFAVSVILVGLSESEKLETHGRLRAETVRDIRYVNAEEELAQFGGKAAITCTESGYGVDVPLA